MKHSKTIQLLWSFQLNS